MAEFTADEFVHELLLILYHTKFRDKYLSADAIGGIEEFIGMCRAKDRLDNSQTSFVVENYYDLRNGLSKCERRAQVGLSDAALYRFRVKIASSLMDYLNSDNR